MIGFLLSRLFLRQPRGEVKLFSYAEADRLLREYPPQWKLAREEDRNEVIGVVYLERVARSMNDDLSAVEAGWLDEPTEA